MHPVLTVPIETTRQLDPGETARVLAKALQVCAEIELHVRSEGVDYESPATLIGEDGSYLLLNRETQWRTGEGESAQRPFPNSDARCAVHVVMEVGDTRYAFDTRFPDTAAQSDPRVIQVFKPDTLWLADRRRSPRRRLQRPTEVVLRATGAEVRWRCKAAMLNLSADGIACRIPAADAASLGVGQTLLAAFRVDDSSPDFILQARITNLTEGGTVDQMVIGLEFIADASLMANQIRLRKALEQNR